MRMGWDMSGVVNGDIGSGIMGRVLRYVVDEATLGHLRLERVLAC